MTKQIVAIVNPISGRRDVIKKIDHIGSLIEQAGGCFDIQITKEPGHATQIISTLSCDTHAILVAGGDGTVSEVVNGFQDRCIPMVILPTGTSNLLARELDMPTEHQRIADTLLYGEIFHSDVGIVNHKRFLAVSGVGFDAECVIHLNRLRKGHITHWSYFWPIWRAFWSYRFPELRVEADSELLFVGRGFLLVGIIKYYATGIQVLKHAKHDDGLLDLVIFPCSKRLGLFIHAVKGIFNLHLDRGGVMYRQCRHIRVSSQDDVPIEIDGEEGGVLPVEWSIWEESVKFLRLPIRG